MELRKVICELLAKGHTEKRIAEMVAAESGETCSQATINRIKRGVIADPAFSLGRALLRIHGRECALSVALHHGTSASTD